MNCDRPLLLLTLLCTFLSAQLRADVAMQELADRSEWWPEKVAVKESVVGPLNAREIKPGRQGFVIRLEEEYALVDFGRFGVLRLPIEKTTFIEESEKIRPTRTWEDLGLWTAQLHTKLMVAIPDGFRPERMEVFAASDYFIIFYLNTQTSEGQAILSWMRDSEAIENLPDAQSLILIPEDTNMGDYNLELMAYDYSGYTLIWPLAQPYRELLQHNPGTAAAAVIDKNGRNIFLSDTISQGTDLAKLFDELQRRISQDEERRKTISQSE